MDEWGITEEEKRQHLDFHLMMIWEPLTDANWTIGTFNNVSFNRTIANNYKLNLCSWKLMLHALHYHMCYIFIYDNYPNLYFRNLITSIYYSKVWKWFDDSYCRLYSANLRRGKALANLANSNEFTKVLLHQIHTI